MRTIIALLLTFYTLTAGAFDLKNFDEFKPTDPYEPPVSFAAKDQPVVVVGNGEFAVINYGKSDLCPSGGYYLISIKRKTYQPIDAGTCSSRTTATLEAAKTARQNIRTQQLTFWVGTEITARYPLYDY